MKELTKETCVAFYRERKQFLAELAKKHGVIYDEWGADDIIIFSLSVGTSTYCMAHMDDEILYVSFDEERHQYKKELVKIE